MDELRLTRQEVHDLVHLLLEAVDIAEGTMQVPMTWTYQVWEQCLTLLDRLEGEEGSP